MVKVEAKGDIVEDPLVQEVDKIAGGCSAAYVRLSSEGAISLLERKTAIS